MDTKDKTNFVENLDAQSVERFICKSCQLVLQSPVQTLPCGHRFCANCIGPVINS